jgi:hypothetical protein
MKTPITGLLKGGITRRSMLAAVLPAAGLSLAMNGHAESDNRVNRLGGGWIAYNADTLFSHMQIPLDPEGKSAALILDVATYSESTAQFLALPEVGADSFTSFVGSIHMTGKDEAEGTIMAYGLASGNPPVPPLLKFIMVISALFQFTSPDTMECDWTYAIYPPSNDGLPHGDPWPPGILVGEKLFFNRVPFVPYSA